MTRRLAYPALLALPFLVGRGGLEGADCRDRHLSRHRRRRSTTCRRSSTSPSGLDFERYPAAQTPLFHVLFAGWGKVVGFELWRLRLLEVVISYAARARAVPHARASRPGGRGGMRARAAAGALSLLPGRVIHAAHRQPGHPVRPAGARPPGSLRRERVDAGAGPRLPRDRGGGADRASRSPGSCSWPPSTSLRSPWPPGRKAAGGALLAVALAPFAALVIDWGGLVPPGSDPASCGVCGDRTRMRAR